MAGVVFRYEQLGRTYLRQFAQTLALTNLEKAEYCARCALTIGLRMRVLTPVVAFANDLLASLAAHQAPDSSRVQRYQMQVVRVSEQLGLVLAPSTTAAGGGKAAGRAKSSSGSGGRRSIGPDAATYSRVVLALNSPGPSEGSPPKGAPHATRAPFVDRNGSRHSARWESAR